VPIKVVSERLGHSMPGFTTATYQHFLRSVSLLEWPSTDE
jgi:hypothetical protein